ncbi:MAG TPA: tetratricopeptide repeat protein [Casimicrobiaceae bacterium]
MSDPVAAVRQALAKGNPAEALQIAKTHADSLPTDARAARFYAAVSSEVGDGGAEQAWRAVLALLPADAEAHYVVGNIEGERSNYVAAAAHFRAALAHAPSHPQIRASLGLALEELGHSREAEACFREAIAGLSETPYQLTAALARNLFRQRRYTDALQHFDTLARKSGIADAALNAAYAACLSAAGRDTEADSTFRRALEREPAAADIARDYAAFLIRCGRHADAAVTLERVTKASGADLLAASMLLMCRLQLGDWRDVAALRRQLIERVTHGLSGRDDLVPAYDFLAISDDPMLQRQVAERWASADAPTVSSRIFPKQYSGKLRLGFLSSDYNNHPVGRLIVGLLERLDRSRFEVAAYATSTSAGDAFGARIEAAVDRYRIVDRRDPEMSVRTLKGDGLDILFDLNGFSGGEAIRLFAQRPAPMQVNFLGYTGTLGCAAYDFVVTDRYCVSPAQQDAFAERLLYVDPCYMPSDPKRRIATPPPLRGDYGLPNRGLVFCAFAAIYKIVPELFDAWMTLLRAVPDSTLWLRHHPADRIERLRAAANERGVDGARLVSAPGESIERYLARFRLADLFLDSFPFGSHTTVNDALFAGLPVVTIAGQSFAGRASASQVRSGGLPHLVAQNFDEYIDIARMLADDRGRLAELRRTLIDAQSSSPLFDSDAYARAFEAAIVEAHETRASGI